MCCSPVLQPIPAGRAPLPCKRPIQLTTKMMDYASARSNMVESQVRPNRVTDPRIVMAMLSLPRENFVPKPLRGIAYVDEDIHVGDGRYLMEPMVLARLIQEAQIAPEDVVLEIGTATGYGAAVLSRLASTVVALESDAAMARSASKTLSDLGLDNVAVVEGDLGLGYPRQAPYNVIVLAGGVEHVPSAIMGQLAEGGRLVAVVVPPGQPGRATLSSRIGGSISTRVIFDASSPILPGFRRDPGFVF
jgi:protein-L-isoaspartate(D-aspartate) O-methyltransferase